ncbi:MAG: SH3 domain-containing protein [Anaerolineae bacterium]
MRYKLWLSLCSVLCCVALVTAQNGQCTDVIELALASANEACENTGRNQACYGNIALDASGQPDVTNFQFSQIGDIVDVAAIQSLELSGYNAETGAWGVVLMRLQANLPETLPGQNVTVLLFGDTTLRNAANSVAAQVPPEQQQRISADTTVNVRALPTTNGRVLGSLQPNAEITATGRTADNQWLRVIYDDQTGWIASFLLTGDESLENLLIVEPETEQYGPMQAFYLTTGIGRPNCNEVPDDGMVVQTPEGVGTVNLAVNGVDVEMGSTVYFNVDEDRFLNVRPVEGAARVRANGMSRTSIAGTRVRIPLDETGEVNGEPTPVESYQDEDGEFEYLPYELLERDIEWEDGLTDEEFELYLEYELLYENLQLEDLDEVFDYLLRSDDDEDLSLLDYLINDLGYADFDDDVEFFFEDLGYDFGEYDAYYGDDAYPYYSDDGDYYGGEEDGYYDESYNGDDDGYYDESYYSDDGGYYGGEEDGGYYDDSYSGDDY